VEKLQKKDGKVQNRGWELQKSSAKLQKDLQISKTKVGKYKSEVEKCKTKG
jgi:hypothetical protein